MHYNTYDEVRSLKFSNPTAHISWRGRYSYDMSTIVALQQRPPASVSIRQSYVITIEVTRRPSCLLCLCGATRHRHRIKLEFRSYLFLVPL